MYRRFMSLFLVLLMWGAVPQVADAGLQVVVSILPQKYVMEQLGGDLVECMVMVRPGASPATYEPTPGQMSELLSARAYFAIGVPFEETWLPRISAGHEDMLVIHTEASIARMPMAAHSHEHDHEDEGEHEGEHEDDHEGEPEGDAILDPHVWLSPELMKTIAANTCQGLVAIDPDNREVYEQNLAAFLESIGDLDAAIRQELETLPEDKRAFMVFHPSWGYFARQYGLEQIAIEAEGKEPGPRQLAEIISRGRELSIGVVFIQPQFSARSAKVIAAELDAGVSILDPLAEDWADNLLRAAGAFIR